MNFEFNEFFRISEKIQFIMSNFNKRLVLASHKPHFASKNVRFYEFEFGTEKYVADVQLTATHSVRKMLQKNSIHQSCTTELVPSAFSFAIEIFRWRSPPKYFTNRTHRCHFDRWSSNFHHEKKLILHRMQLHIRALYLTYSTKFNPKFKKPKFISKAISSNCINELYLSELFHWKWNRRILRTSVAISANMRFS